MFALILFSPNMKVCPKNNIVVNRNVWTKIILQPIGMFELILF